MILFISRIYCHSIKYTIVVSVNLNPQYLTVSSCDQKVISKASEIRLTTFDEPAVKTAINRHEPTLRLPIHTKYY
jgi:hypothetical protein